MKSLTVVIYPDNVLSKNRRGSAHWTAVSAATRQARDDAFVLGRVEMEADWKTLRKACIEIVQYHARRPLDYDGLACVCAPTIDGLVDAGVMADDDPSIILSYNMRHEKVKTVAENRIEITVSERPKGS
jgi:predicted GNAT family acetyltransferase